MSHPEISVQPLAGALGAEITGVDLSRPLENHQLATLRAGRDGMLDRLGHSQRTTPAVEHPVVRTHSETGRKL